MFQQGQQVEIQFSLDQDAQHPQGGAAQRERVLGARRRLTDGEDTEQCVQPVGQRQVLAGGGRRQPVTGKARQILFLQGLGDLGGFSIVARVVAAHDALQFGKFLHHLGHQIALGQPCRPFGPVRVTAAFVRR
jgi:hypothetical protein